MRILGAVVATVLLVAACGGEQPSDAAAPDLRPGRLATLADLVGPWQPEPFVIDGNVRAAADRACRADGDFPPGVQLADIDARGDGRLMSVYAGPGGTMAECVFTKIAADGSVTGSLSGTTTSVWTPLAPGRVEPGMGGGFSDGVGAVQYVVGRVGAGTGRVVLGVEGIGPVTATLDNGWYIAWWKTGVPAPANELGPRIRQKRYTTTAYDVFGQVTDQAQQ